MAEQLQAPRRQQHSTPSRVGKSVALAAMMLGIACFLMCCGKGSGGSEVPLDIQMLKGGIEEYASKNSNKTPRDLKEMEASGVTTSYYTIPYSWKGSVNAEGKFTGSITSAAAGSEPEVTVEFQADGSAVIKKPKP